MNQRRAVQRAGVTLVIERPPRDVLQVVVDQRNHLIERRPVPCAPADQQIGDIRHPVIIAPSHPWALLFRPA